MIKTKFIYEPELEGERLLHSFQSLIFRRYRKAGLLVLPYRVAGEKRVVYLPKLKRWGWEKVKKVLEKHERVVDVPVQSRELVELAETVRLGLEIEPIDKQKGQEVERRWWLIEEFVWGAIEDVFPELRGKELKLMIYWTRYGASMSYGTAKKNGKKVGISLFLRDDMGVGEIIEGIVSAWWLEEFVKQKYSWEQMEAIVDFVLTKTKLRSLVKGFVPTLQPTSYKKMERYYQDSIAYLQELGVGVKKGIEVKDGRVWVEGKPARVNFSEFEYKVLERLVQKKGEVVDYFELGEVLWGEEADRFSLWALSRLIYKLRYKLNQCGFVAHKLRNVRGRGYQLVE